MNAGLITLTVIVSYVLIGTFCAALVARHYYWHLGTPGMWGSGERFSEGPDKEDSIAAVICMFFMWPATGPIAFAMLIAHREPKAIREARRKQELKAFAEREGLEL